MALRAPDLHAKTQKSLCKDPVWIAGSETRADIGAAQQANSPGDKGALLIHRCSVDGWECCRSLQTEALESD